MKTKDDRPTAKELLIEEILVNHVKSHQINCISFRIDSISFNICFSINNKQFIQIYC